MNITLILFILGLKLSVHSLPSLYLFQILLSGYNVWIILSQKHKSRNSPISFTLCFPTSSSSGLRKCFLRRVFSYVLSELGQYLIHMTLLDFPRPPPPTAHCNDWLSLLSQTKQSWRSVSCMKLTVGNYILVKQWRNNKSGTLISLYDALVSHLLLVWLQIQNWTS